jgi:hypothetical protein
LAEASVNHLVGDNPQTLEILSCGVDWLTATASLDRHKWSLGKLADIWIEREARDGNTVEPWSANGYLGEKTKGISFGERADGLMLRLSGEMARKYTDAALLHVDNVSRIDFQVTVVNPNAEVDYCDIAEACVSEDPRVASARTQVTSIHSSNNGRTMYLGRRISERFYRIYDKTAESKGEFPNRSWRFEVEYKGNRAKNWGDKLKGHVQTPDDVRQYVAMAFRDYGYHIPVEPIPTQWRDTSPRPATDDFRRMDYLKRCIAPLVERLIESQGEHDVYEVLGLKKPVATGGTTPAN